MPEARSSVNKNRRVNSKRKMEELEREKEKEGQIARDKRREAVDRLLTSMHLLTCSNGLRYFNIKLTAGGQVSRIPILL